MRIRPYISDLDFDEIRNWITDERTHSLWCANRFQYPLVQEDFENKLSEMKQRYGETPFIATTDEGKVVGFFSYSLNVSSNEGMLKFIMVSPECRGNGYGSKMVCLAVKYAFENTKADMVHLNVFSNNSKAIKCYLNVGFLERSITDNAFQFNNEIWKRCNMAIRKNT